MVAVGRGCCWVVTVGLCGVLYVGGGDVDVGVVGDVMWLCGVLYVGGGDVGVGVVGDVSVGVVLTRQSGRRFVLVANGGRWWWKMMAGGGLCWLMVVVGGKW